MNDDRYPKICFNQLLQVAEKPHLPLKKKKEITLGKYNWCIQLTNLIRCCSKYSIREIIRADNMNLIIMEICDNFKNAAALEVRSRFTSSSLLIYPYLDIREGLQPYLKLKLPMYITKPITQCRWLPKDREAYIRTRNMNIRLRLDSFCHKCSQPMNNAVFHLLNECTDLNHERKILGMRVPYFDGTAESNLTLLNTDSKDHINALYTFLTKASKSWQ